jgi:hypothetical protein
VAKHVGNGLEGGSLADHLRGQRMAQRMRPAIPDTGALEEIVDAVLDVDFIALLRHWRLARWIEEPCGARRKTAQINCKGFADILSKRQCANPMSLGATHLQGSVAPVDVTGQKRSDFLRPQSQAQKEQKQRPVAQVAWPRSFTGGPQRAYLLLRQSAWQLYMLPVGNRRQRGIPAARHMLFSRQIAQKAAKHHKPYLLCSAAG